LGAGSGFCGIISGFRNVPKARMAVGIYLLMRNRPKVPTMSEKLDTQKEGQYLADIVPKTPDGSTNALHDEFCQLSSSDLKASVQVMNIMANGQGFSDPPFTKILVNGSGEVKAADITYQSVSAWTAVSWIAGFPVINTDKQHIDLSDCGTQKK